MCRHIYGAAALSKDLQHHAKVKVLLDRLIVESARARCQSIFVVGIIEPVVPDIMHHSREQHRQNLVCICVRELVSRRCVCVCIHANGSVRAGLTHPHRPTYVCERQMSTAVKFGDKPETNQTLGSQARRPHTHISQHTYTHLERARARVRAQKEPALP